MKIVISEKTLENRKTYNVGIKYLIPKESSDGALLVTDELSFSPNQNEYLINKGSLTKTIDVKIDTVMNQAQLIAVLLPKKIWNLDSKKEIEKKHQNKIIHQISNLPKTIDNKIKF
ncbi:MAG: hypothetical protein PUB18_03220 [bacterium]|nr:hypothetical protein [bacterium]